MSSLKVSIIAMATMILLSVYSYGGTDELSKWVGQYSDGSPKKTKHTFLKDPHVRKIVSTAMPAEVFEKILEKELFSMFPVQKTGDYITLRQCMPHACTLDTIMLAINPKTSRAIVLRYTWDTKKGEFGNYKAETKCYSTASSIKELPDAVKNEFLSHFVERDYSDEDISGLYRANKWIDSIKCLQYK